MPPLRQSGTIEDWKMKTLNFARAAQAALIAAVVGGPGTAALADIKDYEFDLVDQTVEAGPDRVIAVRLINTKTGKPVPDAVIFATRLDMAPDGMQEMADQNRRRCRALNPGLTGSRRRSVWPGAGSCRLAPRCRAKPAPSKTNSSSRRRNEPRLV